MPNLLGTVNGQRSTVNRKSFGFTLIELLIVISIIGVLASLGVASFTSAQQKGRDASRKSDLDAVKKALELYKSDTSGGSYPGGNFVGLSSTLVPTYIKTLPNDPKGSPSAPIYIYTPAPPGCYTSGGTCTSHTLVACLENANDPQADASKNASCSQSWAKASYTVQNP